jgi:hypothetical protein
LLARVVLLLPALPALLQGLASSLLKGGSQGINIFEKFRKI